MTEIKYHVFGSADSQDCDIMVFVDAIGSVAETRVQLAEYKTLLQPAHDKIVNINLAIVRDGIVTEVFKGTADEVNNSLIDTYAFHNQTSPLIITSRLKRDSGIKALRAMRGILSFISRTQYRGPIKQALAGTATDKHGLLKAIEFKYISDLGHKNTNLVDFYKTLAFQMGQSFLLNQGIEAYTKSDIGMRITDLAPFLNRIDGADVFILDNFKDVWLASFDPTQIPEYEELRR